MHTQNNERGQALILIVFAIIGLFGMTGLAVDGGMTYSDRRNAQNAADSAALTGALELVRGHSNWRTIATTVAATNGYQDNGANILVHVSNPPSAGCNGQVWKPGPSQNDQNPAHYVQVIIHSTIRTFFASVVGISQLHNCVEAISRALTPINGSPFPGDVIVGLAPDGNSFDSGQSNAAHWSLTGGGIFANSDAHSKNPGSVTFNTPGACATAVGTISGFGCAGNPNSAGLFLNYPSDIIPLLPPIPACDGKAYTGIDGLIHPDPDTSKDGSVVNGLDHQYGPGLYCIDNIGGNIHDTITGTGVTFYIRDTSFSFKFNGHGSLAATAPTTGKYAGVLMFSGITPTPCTQDMEIRGEGSTPLSGTIFMPSACIDFRGNGTGDMTRTQLIGYRISSNGNADVQVSYNPDDNYKTNLPGRVELTK